jgi:hypothetical protein
MYRKAKREDTEDTGHGTLFDVVEAAGIDMNEILKPSE